MLTTSWCTVQCKSVAILSTLHAMFWHFYGVLSYTRISDCWMSKFTFMWNQGCRKFQ
jgi:hypothetical protein